jgi:hypothetical protein
MAIIIKEIQVKTSIEREKRPLDVSDELIRQIKQSVLDEIRYERQKNKTANRKER